MSLRAKQCKTVQSRGAAPLQERRENVEENGTVFELEEKRGICFQKMAAVVGFSRSVKPAKSSWTL